MKSKSAIFFTGTAINDSLFENIENESTVRKINSALKICLIDAEFIFSAGPWGGTRIFRLKEA